MIRTAETTGVRRCSAPRSILLWAPLWGLAAALLLWQGPATGEEIRIGVYGQDPPRSFVDADGNLRGFDIDIARALCAEVRLDCELVPMEWSALIPAIEERTLNAAVASISITDERRQRVDFTRPYYDTPARFVAHRGAIVGIEPRDLAGKRIGVRRGTTFDRYVTDHYGDNVGVVRYSTQASALLDLVLGRVDLVLANAAVLRATFLDTGHGADFGFVGPELRDPRWFGHGIGVAVGKRNTGLRRLLDRAVANIHVNGIFDRIARTWFEGQALRGPATQSRPD